MAAQEAAGNANGDQRLGLQRYPTPLSPPYPKLSKSVELRRAMSASSRSALFSVHPSHFIFHDDSLFVLNKPPGIYCEALLSALSSFLDKPTNCSTKCPKEKIQFSSENKEIKKSGQDRKIENTPFLHLANRIDRDTSGLTVIARTREAAAGLARAFEGRTVRKSYVARCVGARAPTWRAARVVSGHGRSRHGAWRVYAASDVGRGLPGGSTVREMETRLELAAAGCEEAVYEKVVEERGWGWDEGRGEGEGVELLVRAFPKSGRTHQIRLHCQYLGIPIKGDVKYGGVVEWEGVECEMHCLHAEGLFFHHPVTGEPLQLHAPPPPWASI